jgi:hypothetical protein
MLARLDPDALAARLEARGAALGRRARHDAEVAVILRLLDRHRRFAHGRSVHAADALTGRENTHRLGCLPAVALLCAPAIVLCLLLLIH